MSEEKNQQPETKNEETHQENNPSGEEEEEIKPNDTKELKDKVMKIGFTQEEKKLEPIPAEAEPTASEKKEKKEETEKNQIKEKIIDNNNVTLYLDGGKIVDENYDKNKINIESDDDMLTRKIPSYYDEDKYIITIKQKPKDAKKKTEEEEEISDSDDDEDAFPSKIIGNVKKKSNRIGFINSRFLEIDSLKGTFKRYKTSKDYPQHPNEVISLKAINSVRRIQKEDDKDYYELELTFTNEKEKKVILYRINHEECRDKWNECLSILCRWAVRGEEMPHVNKHKILFIDDDMGAVQEIIRSSKKQTPEEESKVSLKKFKILEEIGRDEFGTIYKVLQKKTEQVYAMKVMSKDYLISKKHLHCVINEFEIMQALNGFPFVSDLHYAFQTANYLYLITDYCEGGDFTNIKSVNNLKLFFSEVICAIEHFQSKNIIYRDLKPESILLDEEGHIKINNFYLAKRVEQGEKARAYSFCGTPRYFSPEMMSEEGVTEKSDIYGIGLLIYEFVTGVPAFKADTIEELVKKIKNNEINFAEGEMYGEVKELVESILVKNPEERPSIEDIKNHPYLREMNFVKVMLKSYGPIKVEKQVKPKEEEKTTTKTEGEEKEKNVIKQDFRAPRITIKEIKDDRRELMRNSVKDFYFVKKEHLKDLVVKHTNPPITNKEILDKFK